MPEHWHQEEQEFCRKQQRRTSMSNHAITIPSANGKPNPTPSLVNGNTITVDTATLASNPNPTLALDPGNTPPQHPWICAFHCTVESHSDIVYMQVGYAVDTDGNEYLDDQGNPSMQFSVTDAEAADNTYGSVSLAFNPPLS
jgi:hypothetical protein